MIASLNLSQISNIIYAVFHLVLHVASYKYSIHFQL